jgi:hypothetical protein
VVAVAVAVPGMELLKEIPKVSADLNNHVAANYVGQSAALILKILRQGDVRRAVGRVNV